MIPEVYGEKAAFPDQPIEIGPWGRGGGGGGKGGGGAQHVATEDPNTLRSRALAKVIDLISEGEIVGLATGDEKSIYFNNVPLKNGDGSFNFSGVTWDFRYG